MNIFIALSDALYNVLLLFIGGLIGALAQPLGHILKIKYDDRRKNDSSISETAKKAYNRTSYYTNKIIDKINDINKILLSSEIFSDDFDLSIRIEVNLNELKDFIRDFKDLRVSIDVIKDQEIKSLIDGILSETEAINTFLRIRGLAPKLKYKESDYTKLLENLNAAFSKFKTIVFEKF